MTEASRRRLSWLAVLLATATPLRAQLPDQARLTAGIAIGRIGGAALWTVENQPIASVTTLPDLFTLRRSLYRDITVSGQVTYFPGPHLGFSGEFSFLGLRYNDGCTLVEHHGDPTLVAACDSLKQTFHSAATTHAQAGVTYRPIVRGSLQPFLRATAGVAFVPSSPVEMVTVFGHAEGAPSQLITIYRDSHWLAIRPSWMLAAGFSTMTIRGLQLRIEARETWLPLRAVAGPTAGQGLEPDSRSVTVHVPSVLIGFDLVFAQMRGRRY